MKNERDKTVVDLDPGEIFTEGKKTMNMVMSSFPLVESPGVKYFYFSQFFKIALREFSNNNLSECRTDNLLLTYT